MTNPVVYTKRCGETMSQRYELVRKHTENVYGSGRPAFGVHIKSDPIRRLISDEWVWFEGPTGEADREAFIAELVRG